MRESNNTAGVDDSEVYAGVRLLWGDPTAWTREIDETDDGSNRVDGTSNVDMG